MILFVQQNMSMQRKLAENMAIARAREQAVSLLLALFKWIYYIFSLACSGNMHHKIGPSLM